MKTYSKYFTSAAVVGLLASPAVMIPTEGWSAIDEMLVTTRRRTESLQSIPVAVAAFDEDLIESQALRSTEDVMKLVPGVQFDQSFSLNDTRIAIRGINNSRGRASAAVLVDGVDVSGETIAVGGGSSLLNTRLIDLERVEVVKGPQSALYGRNAFAGAINYITKRPSMDGLEGNVSVDVAEHGTYEVRGRISAPLVQDKLAVSINAATFERDGFYTNPINGADLNGAESDGFGVGILFNPTDRISVFGNVTYSEDKSSPRAAVPNFANTTTSAFKTQFGFFDIFYQDFFGVVDGQEEGVQLSDSMRTGGAFLGSDDETLRASLIVEWDFDSVILKSTTGYLDNDSLIHSDTDFTDGTTSAPLTDLGFPFQVFDSVEQDFYSLTDTEYWSQEFTLESNTDGRVNWLVGVNGFWEETKNADDSHNYFIGGPTGYMASNFFCGVVPCSYAESVAFGVPTKDITRETESYSVFGLVGFEVTDKLNVTAEARYIYDKVEVATNTPISRTEQTGLGCDPTGLPGFVCMVDTSGDALSGENKSYAFNPRLSLDYQINDDAMIYASVARGTKPGGFATTQMPSIASAEVDQEKLTSYEIGAKTSWLEGRLQLNAATYFNVYEDRQVGFTVPCPGDPSFACAGNGNAGEAETKGFELDALWQPIDELTVAVGYSYIDAEFTDFDFNQLRVSGPNPAQAAKCGPALDGNCDGAPVAGVPENAFTTSIEYRAPLSNSNLEWFVQGGAQWTDKRALDSFNVTSYVDSFWNVDAQIGVESDRYRVALYATNLFDDDTVRNGQVINDFKNGLDLNGGPYHGMAVAFLPPPRTVGLRVNLKFGGN